ncbi:MAG: hypothetical protein J2P18_01200, partial [Nocardia sp.]|nr:hypothetical protein [Nocardia sp.]
GGSAAPAPAGTPADAATTKAVTDAFVQFFDAKQPADKRAAVVQNGPAFQPVIAAMGTQPTSATVAAVSTTDPTHANVTYSLLMNGQPALANQAGQAIQDNGQWKVAATTFCALAKLQPGAAVPGC